MTNLNKVLIGKNVKSLRISSGLTQLNFSILMGISLRQVNYLERGSSAIKYELLENISRFFNISTDELTKDLVKPSYNLKEKLLKYHRKNSEYIKILDDTPNIVYAVENKLLPSDFLNLNREIKEIRTFFSKLGWDFKGSSITNTLTRMPDRIDSKPHPTKKGTNLYAKKR